MLAGLVGLGLAAPARAPGLAGRRAARPRHDRSSSSGAILLGVRHPQSLLLQGSVFAGLALAWLAIRARRASAAVQGGSTSYVRGAGRRRDAGPGRGGRLPRERPGRPATTTSGPWPATGSSRPSTSAATPRRSPASASTSTSRADTDRANVYDKTLLDVEGVDGRDPGPLRHHGPLRRHGLGRQRQRPARARPTTPSSGCPPRSTTRSPTAEGDGRDGRHRHPRRGLVGRLAADGRCAAVDGVRDRRRRAPRPRSSATTSPPRRPSCRPASQPGDRYSFTAVQPDDALTPETVGSAERHRPAGRRRASSRGRRRSGPRAPAPTRWTGSWPPPSTSGPRASTPTASVAPSASTSPATACGGSPTSSSTPRRSSATTSSTPPRWR